MYWIYLAEYRATKQCLVRMVININVAYNVGECLKWLRRNYIPKK
jgi:hypothetical protein